MSSCTTREAPAIDDHDPPPARRASLEPVKIRLRNPDRELVVPGPRSVRDVLAELAIDPDTVLVIRERTLVTREERLDDTDEIEVRPVISGGAAAKLAIGGGLGSAK